jgi:hypothetical protein
VHSTHLQVQYNTDGQVSEYGLDGQDYIVRLQTDNFHRFHLKQMDKQLRLHDEQTVNGLRKIAWASVFSLKCQHMLIFIYMSIYMLSFQNMYTVHM